MAYKIQLRRDTELNWISNNPILAPGEIGWVVDKKKFKVGDGQNVWNDLEYINITTPYVSFEKIKNYLYNVTYVDLDYNFAKSHFLVSKPELGSCSTVRNGRWVGRNFDCKYSTNPEFVIRTPRNSGKYATLGVASNVPNLKEPIKEINEEAFKLLPFYTMDAINEYGLSISNLVVPMEKGQTTGTLPLIEKREEICNMMLLRFMIDRFKTAREAVDYVEKYVSVYSPQSLADAGYELHFMVSDKAETYSIEFVDNTVVINNISEKPYMTNFYLEGVTFNTQEGLSVPVGGVYTPATVGNNLLPSSLGITSLGSGLERFNLICENYSTLTTKEAMKSLMLRNNLSEESLRYTRGYLSSTSPAWNSDFVGNWNWVKDGVRYSYSLTADSPESEFSPVKNYQRTNYERGIRDGKTWFTQHSCVYDLEGKKLYLIVQEDGEELEFSFEYYTREELNNKFQPKLDSSNAGPGIEIIGEGKDLRIKSTVQVGDGTLKFYKGDILLGEFNANTFEDKVITIPECSSSDKNYVHNQDTPSTVWEVTHNLNKCPAISIVTSSGDEVYANIEYIDNNHCKIYFSNAFSGKVYCN